MTSRSSSRLRSSTESADISPQLDPSPVPAKRSRLSSSSSTPSGETVARENDDEERENDTWTEEFRFENKRLRELSTRKPAKLSDKDEFKWQNLSKDAQKMCLKTLVRYFLFRASKGETITRVVIAEQLSKAGDFKAHVAAATHHASVILEREFGYVVVNGSDIIGNTEDKPSDKASEKSERSNNYFICNSKTDSPRLLHALVDSRGDAAWVGFMYAVLSLILVSPNNRAKLEDIRRQLRVIDSRFPETSTKTTRGSSRVDKDEDDPEDAKRGRDGKTVAVPELQDELEGLIARMKKVRFTFFKLL